LNEWETIKPLTVSLKLKKPGYKKKHVWQALLKGRL